MILKICWSRATTHRNRLFASQLGQAEHSGPCSPDVVREADGSTFPQQRSRVLPRTFISELNCTRDGERDRGVKKKAPNSVDVVLERHGAFALDDRLGGNQ